MSDRTYELLEKMYIEFSGKFESLDKNVMGNSEDILKLENDISGKLGALFDAYETTNDRLNLIERKLNEVSNNVDKHDIKIQVIEGGKKKKKI